MLAGRGKKGHIRLTLGAPALLLMLLLAGLNWGANICFPDALPTLLRLSVEDQPNTQATLNAYLYALDSSSGQREVVPISGGLLLVSWGNYSAHVCRMVTGKDGKVSAVFSNKGSDYPGGGESRTYTVTFCPFTAYNNDPSKPNTEWMANCARFKDSGTGKAITRLNYETVSVCPGAPPDNPVKEFQVTTPTGYETHDLGDLWQPSTSFLTLRNNSPSAASAAFCWGLAAVFGLLFSAMFITGRNPLSFLDWGATRNVRVNRAAGFYIPASKNVSIAPVSVLLALDRGANMVAEATGTGSGSGEIAKAKADVAKAKAEVKVARANNNKVQDDPKSTPEQKQAAQTNLASAKANLANATTILANTRAAYSFNRNMQRASQGGLVSGWLDKQIKGGVNAINPFTDSEGKSKPVFGSSLLGDMASTLFGGMVRTVALAVPGMAMGRGKFGMKRVTTALGDSAKRQARATVKEELIEAIRWGANVVAPLLVHGFGSAEDVEKKNKATRELAESTKELNAAQNDLESKWKAMSHYFETETDGKTGQVRLKFEEDTETGEMKPKPKADVGYFTLAQQQVLFNSFQAAQERVVRAQERFDTASATYDSVGAAAYNQAVSTASSSLGDLANGLMNPLFELMADKWFGSEQPPRLQAMSGWGAVLGLTVSDYLTSPLKRFDPRALQNQLEALARMRQQK